METGCSSRYDQNHCTRMVSPTKNILQHNSKAPEQLYLNNYLPQAHWILFNNPCFLGSVLGLFNNIHLAFGQIVVEYCWQMHGWCHHNIFNFCHINKQMWCCCGSQYSNRSQKTSQCGENITDTLSCANFLFLSYFDDICDLYVSLHRGMTTWNLLVIMLRM